MIFKHTKIVNEKASKKITWLLKLTIGNLILVLKKMIRQLYIGSTFRVWFNTPCMEGICACIRASFMGCFVDLSINTLISFQANLYFSSSLFVNFYLFYFILFFNFQPFFVKYLFNKHQVCIIWGPPCKKLWGLVDIHFRGTFFTSKSTTSL